MKRRLACDRTVDVQIVFGLGNYLANQMTILEEEVKLKNKMN